MHGLTEARDTSDNSWSESECQAKGQSKSRQREEGKRALSASMSVRCATHARSVRTNVCNSPRFYISVSFLAFLFAYLRGCVFTYSVNGTQEQQKTHSNKFWDKRSWG